MKSSAFLLSAVAATVQILTGAVSSARADTVVLNISCGNLYSTGTAAADRLPQDTLCMLVADLAGDGFNPPDASGWTTGDDVLVTVFDTEYLQENGGTKGFDLTSENAGPGVFSRSLAVDLARFGGRTTPVPIALRWFPAYKAKDVNLATSTPAPGSAWGDFSRVTPLYPDRGGQSWFIPMTDGANILLDPCATVALGGLDPEIRGSAVNSIPGGGGGSVLPREVKLVLQLGDVFVTFRGGAALKYEVQRSTGLDVWAVVASQVVTDAAGEGRWRDQTAPAGHAFYRVRGPLP